MGGKNGHWEASEAVRVSGRADWTDPSRQGEGVESGTDRWIGCGFMWVLRTQAVKNEITNY